MPGRTPAASSRATDGAATWKAAAFARTSFALAIDPVTPTTVYACANAVQVAKSLDGAATLNRVTGGIPQQAINALAVDPVTPSTVYIGAANGVFKSTNGGVSATAANTGLAAAEGLRARRRSCRRPRPSTRARTPASSRARTAATSWTSVAVEPERDTRLLARDSPGILGDSRGNGRPEAGGAPTAGRPGRLDTWRGLPYAWAVDPGSPTTVYAAGGSARRPRAGAACKSTDAGSTWTRLRRLDPRAARLREHRGHPDGSRRPSSGRTRVSTGSSVHGGGRLQWVTNSALAVKIVYALAVDPASAFDHLGGHRQRRLFKSTDGGVSWTQVTSLPATEHLRAPVRSRLALDVLRGDERRPLQEHGQGATWTALNAGLTNLVVNAFAIAPGSPQTLYVGIFGGSVFRFPTALPVADFAWAGIPVAGQPCRLHGPLDRARDVLVLDLRRRRRVDGAVPDAHVRRRGLVPGVPDRDERGGPEHEDADDHGEPGDRGQRPSRRSFPSSSTSRASGGARFSTELTLANRGTTTSTIQITYVAATSLGASGGGTVSETLGPGRQVVFPDAIAYLRGKGLTIPTGSSQGGALFVTFEGLSSDSTSPSQARGRRRPRRAAARGSRTPASGPRTASP